METTTRVRLIAAQVIWVAASLAALLLAAGALCVAFQANESNWLVSALLHVDGALDFGIFDREHGLKHWHAENAHTKNALFNWGLAALVWIIIGVAADRFLRPAVTRKVTHE